MSINVKPLAEICEAAGAPGHEQRIREIEGLIGNLPQSERILLNIQRKFNLNENIYNYLLEKRAEASITKASNISDHKVIDMPRLESNLPIRPNTLLIYFISLLVGIFLPIILISLYFLFNDKIYFNLVCRG